MGCAHTHNPYHQHAVEEQKKISEIEIRIKKSLTKFFHIPIVHTHKRREQTETKMCRRKMLKELQNKV
jgi:hypothetical protein